MCIGCFQRMSQPDISYEDLTKDYPRYPDIYDITTIHSVPEDALMVRLLYQSCRFYKISLGICVPWKQIIHNEPTKQIKKYTFHFRNWCNNVHNKLQSLITRWHVLITKYRSTPHIKMFRSTESLRWPISIGLCPSSSVVREQFYIFNVFLGTTWLIITIFILKRL